MQLRHFRLSVIDQLKSFSFHRGVFVSFVFSLSALYPQLALAACPTDDRLSNSTGADATLTVTGSTSSAPLTINAQGTDEQTYTRSTANTTDSSGNSVSVCSTTDPNLLPNNSTLTTLSGTTCAGTLNLTGVFSSVDVTVNSGSATNTPTNDLNTWLGVNAYNTAFNDGATPTPTACFTSGRTTQIGTLTLAKGSNTDNGIYFRQIVTPGTANGTPAVNTINVSSKAFLELNAGTITNITTTSTDAFAISSNATITNLNLTPTSGSSESIVLLNFFDPIPSNVPFDTPGGGNAFPSDTDGNRTKPSQQPSTLAQYGTVTINSPATLKVYGGALSVSPAGSGNNVVDDPVPYSSSNLVGIKTLDLSLNSGNIEYYNTGAIDAVNSLQNVTTSAQNTSFTNYGGIINTFDVNTKAAFTLLNSLQTRRVKQDGDNYIARQLHGIIDTLNLNGSTGSTYNISNSSSGNSTSFPSDPTKVYGINTLNIHTSNPVIVENKRPDLTNSLTANMILDENYNTSSPILYSGRIGSISMRPDQSSSTASGSSTAASSSSAGSNIQKIINGGGSSVINSIVIEGSTNPIEITNSVSQPLGVKNCIGYAQIGKISINNGNTSKLDTSVSITNNSNAAIGLPLTLPTAATAGVTLESNHSVSIENEGYINRIDIIGSPSITGSTPINVYNINNSSRGATLFPAPVTNQCDTSDKLKTYGIEAIYYMGLNPAIITNTNTGKIQNINVQGNSSNATLTVENAANSTIDSVSVQGQSSLDLTNAGTVNLSFPQSTTVNAAQLTPNGAYTITNSSRGTLQFNFTGGTAAAPLPEAIFLTSTSSNSGLDLKNSGTIEVYSATDSAYSATTPTIPFAGNGTLNFENTANSTNGDLTVQLGITSTSYTGNATLINNHSHATGMSVIANNSAGQDITLGGTGISHLYPKRSANTVPFSPVTFEGSGQKVIHFNPDSNTNNIGITFCSSCSLSDLAIDPTRRLYIKKPTQTGSTASSSVQFKFDPDTSNNYSALSTTVIEEGLATELTFSSTGTSSTSGTSSASSTNPAHGGTVTNHGTGTLFTFGTNTQPITVTFEQAAKDKNISVLFSGTNSQFTNKATSTLPVSLCGTQCLDTIQEAVRLQNTEAINFTYLNAPSSKSGPIRIGSNYTGTSTSILTIDAHNEADTEVLSLTNEGSLSTLELLGKQAVKINNLNSINTISASNFQGKLILDNQGSINNDVAVNIASGNSFCLINNGSISTGPDSGITTSGKGEFSYTHAAGANHQTNISVQNSGPTTVANQVCSVALNVSIDPTTNSTTHLSGNGPIIINTLNEASLDSQTRINFSVGEFGLRTLMLTESSTLDRAVYFAPETCQRNCSTFPSSQGYAPIVIKQNNSDKASSSACPTASTTEQTDSTPGVFVLDRTNASEQANINSVYILPGFTRDVVLKHSRDTPSATVYNESTGAIRFDTDSAASSQSNGSTAKQQNTLYQTDSSNWPKYVSFADNSQARFVNTVQSSQTISIEPKNVQQTTHGGSNCVASSATSDTTLYVERASDFIFESGITSKVGNITLRSNPLSVSVADDNQSRTGSTAFKNNSQFPLSISNEISQKAPISLDGSADITFKNTYGSSLDAITFTGSGNHNFIGTSSSTIGQVSFTGSGNHSFTNTSSGAIEQVSFTGSGNHDFANTHGTIEQLTLEGAGDQSITNTSGIIKKLSITPTSSDFVYLTIQNQDDGVIGVRSNAQLQSLHTTKSTTAFLEKLNSAEDDVSITVENLSGSFDFENSNNTYLPLIKIDNSESNQTFLEHLTLKGYSLIATVGHSCQAETAACAQEIHSPNIRINRILLSAKTQAQSGNAQDSSDSPIQQNSRLVLYPNTSVGHSRMSSTDTSIDLSTASYTDLYIHKGTLIEGSIDLGGQAQHNKAHILLPDAAEILTSGESESIMDYRFSNIARDENGQVPVVVEALENGQYSPIQATKTNAYQTALVPTHSSDSVYRFIALPVTIGIQDLANQLLFNKTMPLYHAAKQYSGLGMTMTSQHSQHSQSVSSDQNTDFDHTSYQLHYPTLYMSAYASNPVRALYALQLGTSSFTKPTTSDSYFKQTLQDVNLQVLYSTFWSWKSQNGWVENARWKGTGQVVTFSPSVTLGVGQSNLKRRYYALDEGLTTELLSSDASYNHVFASHALETSVAQYLPSGAALSLEAQGIAHIGMQPSYKESKGMFHQWRWASQTFSALSSRAGLHYKTAEPASLRGFSAKLGADILMQTNLDYTIKLTPAESEQTLSSTVKGSTKPGMEATAQLSYFGYELSVRFTQLGKRNAETKINEFGIYLSYSR